MVFGFGIPQMSLFLPHLSEFPLEPQSALVPVVFLSVYRQEVFHIGVELVQTVQ